MRSKFEVTMWDNILSITSLSFHVNRPSHSWIRLFHNLTLKIQGQGHGRGEHWTQGPTFCRLKSLSFHVNLPSHSWDTAFQIWPWSKVKVRCGHKVTKQHYRLNPFHSMSIGHTIPEIRLFQILTLKIQGQGHGWVTVTKEHPIDSHRFCSKSSLLFRYSIFKIWPRKSKVKVMGFESHKVGVTSYRFTSLLFHVNRPFHSWDTDQNLTKSASMKLSTKRCNILSTHIPFAMSIGHPIPEIPFSKIWPWPRSRSWVRGMLTVTKWV